MSTKKNDASNNNAQTLVYCVVGGVVCCYFVPSYAPLMVFGGGLLFCTYRIIDVLKNAESTEEFNFVEKEKIQYFKK